MLHVFEVHLAEGANPDKLISAELVRDAGAQVMTVEEAQALGFSGVQKAEGREVRIVVVAARDSQWVHRTLESHADVTSYRVKEIET